MNKIIGIEEFVKANDVTSKTFLVRADFNVPISKGVIVEDLRLRAILPTLKLLKSAKVVLISHIECKEENGMEIVAKYFNDNLCTPIRFIDEVIGSNVKNAVDSLTNGEVLLLQNLRVNEGEKNNDESFSKELALLADFYVNDAFSVSHRKHASVVGIPKYLPHFAGIRLMKEINALSEAINPPHPFVFILGGAKFDTKLPLVKKYLEKADYLILGGALSNDVYKARGYNVGKSLTSDGTVNLSCVVCNRKLVLTTDVVVRDVDDDKIVTVKQIEDVSDNDVIVDSGPSLKEILSPIVAKAGFVLWNGPLGNYENGFKEQTMLCAKILIESGVKGAIGGGDTVAAVKSLGLDEFNEESKLFVSTGGGAMIDFLINETLPGIDALA